MKSIDFIVGGLGGSLATLIAYRNWRVVSQAFVAIGPDGVRLRLVKNMKAIRLALFPERRFKWEEIGKITCNDGACWFWVTSGPFILDKNSPSPPEVAQLMAQWKGVQLPAQQPLEPPGLRKMRLKKAARLGGIGLVLMGSVAAGGWWVFSNAPASYNWRFYTLDFLALAVSGLLGLILLLTGVTLAVVERNRRL